MFYIGPIIGIIGVLLAVTLKNQNKQLGLKAQSAISFVVGFVMLGIDYVINPVLTNVDFVFPALFFVGGLTLLVISIVKPNKD